MGDESLIPSQPGADTFLVRDAPACPGAKVNAALSSNHRLVFVFRGFAPCYNKRQMVFKRDEI